MKSPNWKRYHDMVVLKNVSLFVRVLGYVLAVGSFLVFLVMASHSDSVTLWRFYEEVWTTRTYVLVTLSAVACGAVGYIFINVGSLINERAKKWVIKFENHWNSYFK